jgi:pyruvate, orthophosphate dikinase
MVWADAMRTMKVRANADTPADAQKAREFGAEGIGLCRTEHMFFEGDRIQAVREMILAETAEDAAARWRSCCRCSAPTSRASSARWTGSR